MCGYENKERKAGREMVVLDNVWVHERVGENTGNWTELQMPFLLDIWESKIIVWSTTTVIPHYPGFPFHGLLSLVNCNSEAYDPPPNLSSLNSSLTHDVTVPVSFSSLQVGILSFCIITRKWVNTGQEDILRKTTFTEVVLWYIVIIVPLIISYYC